MKIVNTLLSLVLIFFISIDIQAQNFNRAVKVKENFEAAIPHPEQDKEVTNKLAALEKKTGKKPNIVWIVIDDMGMATLVHMVVVLLLEQLLQTWIDLPQKV